MSGASSRGAEWFTQLEPVRPAEIIPHWAGDPRLGTVIETWNGDARALTPNRAVLVGFPQDEGVRRNHGRAGASQAPVEIRRWLYRLTSWDSLGKRGARSAERGAASREGVTATGIDLALHPPLDVGNLRLKGNLEATQEALGEVVGNILAAGAFPIVLGGGHETAYGHYLGYVASKHPVGIVNIDAHLDVRPCTAQGGHSGSPFRQALEHPACPLPGHRYICLGLAPHAASREFCNYAAERGCVIKWNNEVQGGLCSIFAKETQRLAEDQCSVYLTIDADSVRQADVPGVSAPNPAGLAGTEVIACARLAGQSPSVSSLDLVEINPQFDRDGQSCRWGAVVIWNFMMGLAERLN